MVGIVSIVAIIKGVADGMFLSILQPRLDEMVFERGASSFTDRVALPFLSAIFGGLIGAFMSLYVTTEPSLAQRVVATISLGFTLGILISVWRVADRALFQQLYEIRGDISDEGRCDRLTKMVLGERQWLQKSARPLRRWGVIL